MTYVEGFVAAVPRANQDAYRKHAADAVPLFKTFGATRFVECWGDDVQAGKLTDFRRAVQAKDDEEVVFGWLEYPDQAARDAANRRMREDPRMEKVAATMPFDGRRMIFGGFDSIVDERASTRGGYVDGFVLAVPQANRAAYTELASKAAKVFFDYGALRVVEAWGSDVPDGKVTDFRRSVLAETGEQIVFSWVEWPSRQARDEGWQKSMQDERMKPPESQAMPFDGKRMFWGGFVPIVDA